MCISQFSKIDFEKMSEVKVHSWFMLILVLLLMPLNYLFEWLKWRTILNSFNSNFGIQTRFQSFLAGIITGMLTPNMQGNFIGRLYYFPKRFRINIILLTLWSNLAQFIVSISFGLIAIVLLGKVPGEFNVQKYLYPLAGIVSLILLLYFTANYYLPYVLNKKTAKRFKMVLKEVPFFKWKILLFSVLRYLVFSLQFYLILIAFGQSGEVETYLWVWQLYLWTTIAPSLILGKLFIRESIAIWVLGSIGMNEWSVALSAFLIWIFNLLIPTLIGTVVCEKRTLA